MSARYTKLMLDAGPYEVWSRANGELMVRPRWTQFSPSFDDDDERSPGLLSRMQLARDIERFLNGGAS